MYELYILHVGKGEGETRVANPEDDNGLFMEYGDAIRYAQKEIQIDDGDSIDVRSFKPRKRREV